MKGQFVLPCGHHERSSADVETDILYRFWPLVLLLSVKDINEAVKAG